MNLALLKQYEPLYIIGHKHPDLDTVISSYLLAKILYSQGYETEAVFLSENYSIDKYNQTMIDDLLELDFKIVEETENKNFILVDHNDPIQSVGSSNNVIMAFDHHRDSGKVENIVNAKYASNSLLIYDYFKDEYVFSEKERKMIYMATMSDTMFLKSQRYDERDLFLLKELKIELSPAKLFKKYFIASDLSKGVAKCFSEKGKDFEFAEVKFKSSCIKAFDTNEDLLNDYIKLVKQENYFLGMWIDLDKEITHAYFKSPNNFEIREYDFIASRANLVLPDMIEFLNKEKNDVKKMSKLPKR